MYDLTNVFAALNPFTLFVAVNDLSGGLLTGAILFAIYVILIISFKGDRDIKAVLVGVSFIVTLISFGALFLGLIGWPIMIAPILMLFSSLLAFLFLDG